MTMSRFRSNRSTSTPANGPNRIEGTPVTVRRAPSRGLRGPSLGLVVPAGDALHALGPLNQKPSALRARLREGLVPHREVTLGIAVAAVEDGAPAPSGPLHHELALRLPALLLALGTEDAGRLLLPLDVPAVRVAGAADERAVPTDPLHQLLAAFGASFVQKLGLRAFLSREIARVVAFRPAVAGHEPAGLAELDHQLAGRIAALLWALRAGLAGLLLGPLHLLLGLLDLALEGTEELVENLDPPDLPLGDVVELLLHVGGELVVHHLGKPFQEQIDHHDPDVLGEQPAFLDADVVAVLEVRDRRGVRRRPADPSLLQRLHERSLGEPGWPLGEVLLREQLQEPQHLLAGQVGKDRFGVAIGGVVGALEVHAAEPVEL